MHGKSNHKIVDICYIYTQTPIDIHDAICYIEMHINKKQGGEELVVALTP